MENEFICKFCGKHCKNGNSLRNHERLCKLNPERQESHFVKWNETHEAWNKGLSKETDERLKKSAETLHNGYATGRIINSNKGKFHTEEQKQKISMGRKRYLEQHPDKVPYLLNHHSKGDSYPEKYFKEVFDNENVEYKQNYYQSGYFLDFAWPERKLYLEVDGEQHYRDKRIVEHDKKRTQKLLEEGWTCLIRIRWSEYKGLNESQQKEFVKSFIKKLK